MHHVAAMQHYCTILRLRQGPSTGGSVLIPLGFLFAGSLGALRLCVKTSVFNAKNAKIAKKRQDQDPIAHDQH